MIDVTVIVRSAGKIEQKKKTNVAQNEITFLYFGKTSIKIIIKRVGIKLSK